MHSRTFSRWLAVADNLFDLPVAARARVRRDLRALAPTYPILDVPWFLGTRRPRRALEHLLAMTGRADLHHFGPRDRFERLIAVLLDRAQARGWRVPKELITQLSDRRATLRNPDFCGIELVTVRPATPPKQRGPRRGAPVSR